MAADLALQPLLWMKHSTTCPLSSTPVLRPLITKLNMGSIVGRKVGASSLTPAALGAVHQTPCNLCWQDSRV